MADIRWKPQFCHFLQLSRQGFFNKWIAGRRKEKGVPSQSGDIMEDTVHKSCWGVTVRALLAIVVLMGAAFLFGGI